MKIYKSLSVLLILVFCFVAGAWGPITHNSLAKEIATQASDYTHNYRNSDFYAGCIAPDIALAADPGKWDARQSLFHDGAFVDAMKYINLNETQNTMRYGGFIAGYEVHLICDGIESSYTAQKKAPVSSDFGVDKLVGASGGGNIPDNLLAFMLQAWNRAYPGDVSVTLEWLKKAEGNFGLYMSGIYNPVSKADAEKYFSDYRAWYDQSVSESVAYLKSLNVEPEPYIPPPTFTLAPPTFEPPALVPPENVIGDRPNKLYTAAKMFFAWFVSLWRA